MSPEPLERQVRDWLADGPRRAPYEVIESVLAEIPTTRRRNRWLPIGPARSDRPASFTAVVAVAIVAIALVWAWPARVAGPSAASAPVASIQPIDERPFGNGAISDMIAAGPGLIAVGTISVDGHEQVATWTSADGSTWARSNGETALMDLTAGRIVQAGDRTVIVAHTCPAGGTYCGDARLFVSIAGGAWRDVSGSASGSFNAVVAGGPGLVAAGVDEVAGMLVGVVATSSDGTSWSQRSSGPSLAKSTIGGLASGPDGIVAVGQNDGQPAMWRSADALAWTRVAVAGSTGTGSIADVARAGSRWVGVGNVSGRATSWTSADGTTWSVAEPWAALDIATVDRVVAIGPRFVAVGTTSSGDGVALLSPDGISWTRIDTGDTFVGARIGAVAGIDGRLVVLGQTSLGKAVGAVVAP